MVYIISEKIVGENPIIADLIIYYQKILNSIEKTFAHFKALILKELTRLELDLFIQQQGPANQKQALIN